MAERSAASAAGTTLAQAMWNQRYRLAEMADGLRQLMRLVDRPGDFSPPQWLQVAAMTLDFQPDLIIELGRAHGNSTCCFLEAAERLQFDVDCRLLSLCLTRIWSRQVEPRLRQVRPAHWLARGQFLRHDILKFDFTPHLERARRCLVFWDAHGFEVAECVLGHILPLLERKPHLVLMHDLSDLRYCLAPRDYGDCGLWKGENAGQAGFRLGHVYSRVGQALAILDFAARNELPLHSADESLQTELKPDRPRLRELRRLIGRDLLALHGHWFWFTLNEATGPFTYPRYRRGELRRLPLWKKVPLKLRSMWHRFQQIVTAEIP